VEVREKRRGREEELMEIFLSLLFSLTAKRPQGTLQNPLDRKCTFQS